MWGRNGGEITGGGGGGEEEGEEEEVFSQRRSERDKGLFVFPPVVALVVVADTYL